jgi:hypothetical protein
MGLSVGPDAIARRASNGLPWNLWTLACCGLRI